MLEEGALASCLGGVKDGQTCELPWYRALPPLLLLYFFLSGAYWVPYLDESFALLARFVLVVELSVGFQIPLA